MLVSVDRYRIITGDQTSASGVVEAALVDAQDLLEAELRRPLELAERTERCRLFPEDRGSVAYPAATPIVSVTAGTIAGAGIVGTSPDETPSFLVDQPAYGTVTYTGGYDPAETDLAAVTYVPVLIQRAIAWAAYAIGRPFTSDAPEGALSVSVGDVSVSYGPDGAPGQGSITFPSNVRRYRRRLDLVA